VTRSGLECFLGGLDNEIAASIFLGDLERREGNSDILFAYSEEAANADNHGFDLGVKASVQGEGATNKDTQPRDTAPVTPR
jgi:hypothetical protein